MGLFLELVTSTLILVTEPFSLIKIACLLCARVIVLGSITWLQLVKTVINFQVDMCWRLVICIVAVVSLPVRVLTALQRERTLEMNLHEMKIRLENIIWENKELEERLQIAIEERRVMETLLAEIEGEHDKALAQIDLLENESQDLRDDNIRLGEVQGRSLWDYEARDEKGDGKIHEGILLGGTNYGVPSWSSSYDGRGVTLRDMVMHRDMWGDGSKGEAIMHGLLKAGSADAGSYTFPAQTAPGGGSTVEEALRRRRHAALSRSVFSAILSLLVGTIIWEAEDPCMPLVAALFTVVGMSLSSVVQFFSTIKNSPASDAVALLSFNWFILGMLTYPTLPGVARVSTPQVSRLANRVLRWLGYST